MPLVSEAFPQANLAGWYQNVSGHGRFPVRARLHGRHRLDFGALSSARSRLWSFPRLMGRLRRKHSVVSLGDKVQRMSDDPARHFGLKGRGQIETGYAAGIVILDADRVIDTAMHDDPAQYPTGIPYVLVNGRITVDGQACMGSPLVEPGITPLVNSRAALR